MTRQNQGLALLGGTPVRSTPWPSWPVAPVGAYRALSTVLASHRWTVSSRFTGTDSFESTFARNFARFVGVDYCVPCSSGSSALSMALEALGIGYGDDVLVPGLAWVACASAVMRVGARPVLVDIARDNLCMSPVAARRAMTDATRAILLVHSYCSIADLDAFTRLAREAGVRLVEDCSHAHGALYSGSQVGGFGDVSVFSMQQSKLLTSGEGGAVLTKDRRLYERLEQLRADGRVTVRQPQNGEFQLHERGDIQGYNHCLSEFHAAILCCQLPTLPKMNETRRKNATYLNSLLESQPYVRAIYCTESRCRPAIYRFCLRLSLEHFAYLKCELLASALTAELGLPVAKLHPPLDRSPLFCPWKSRRVPPEWLQKLNREKVRLPESISAWRTCVAIPHRAFLGSQEDMHDIARALAKVQEGASSLVGLEETVEPKPRLQPARKR